MDIKQESRRLEIAVVVLLVAAVVALLAVNLVLQRHNRLLSNQIRSLSAADGPPIGSHIEMLRGNSPSLGKVAIKTASSGRKTLLLVFSPACPYCKINMPIWKTAVAHNPNVNVLYIDLSGSATTSYLGVSGLPSNFPLFSLDPEERLLYDLRVTPTTVVLDTSSTVTGKWAGVMNSRDAVELERLLGNS